MEPIPAFRFIGIFVSRFDAVLIASMLKGYDLNVFVDAERHASVEYFSLGLGGHRLYVHSADYDVACEILQTAKTDQNSHFRDRPSPALIRFLALIAACYAIPVFAAVLSGAATAFSLVYVPLAVLSVPVEPKGRADYFLSANSAQEPKH